MRGEDNASVFGPYPDALLIPQLTEIAAGYQLDGAWIDGDIWRAAVDYCDEAKKAFTAATGIGQVPLSPADPNWHAWRDVHRQAYRDYANHYIAEVKKAAPDFDFCCNWAFSTQMPEEVSLDVAFTSGDICGFNCVDVARFCRERQDVCFQAKPVPQIAVCMSTEGIYQRWDAVGQPLFWWDKSHFGSAISFLENQYPVEIVLASRLIKWERGRSG